MKKFVSIFWLAVLLTVNMSPLFMPANSGQVWARPLSQSADTQSVTPDVALTTVTYAPSNAILVNPERGLYHHLETFSSKPATWSYDLKTLQAYRTKENISLVLCLYYLDSFVKQPISDAFLKQIQTNFDVVRNAGLKCVLRFAYTANDHKGKPPFGDATKTQILTHLEQLKPKLQLNSDVIVTVQAGFIGVWGEWYYTDNFVDKPAKPDQISPAQYANRLEVLNKILNILPMTRTVALRTPGYKQEMFHVTTPINAAQAYNGSALARVGFHNDCFLASADDEGTYRTNADRTYMATETQFLAMGGETCAPNPPRSLCPTALQELALFHWSYINRDWHPDVYNSWVSGGCISEIQQRLGYRFVLKQGTYPATAQPGSTMTIRIDLVNQGFAAPYNPRDVYLVLQKVGATTGFKAKLPDDPRRWFANGQTYTINRTFNLPATLATGQYALALYLPDPAPKLNAKPEYAIQLANANVWKPTQGWNDLLHTVNVTNAATKEADISTAEGIDFVEFDALPQSEDDATNDKPELNGALFLPLVTK